MTLGNSTQRHSRAGLHVRGQSHAPRLAEPRSQQPTDRGSTTRSSSALQPAPRPQKDLPPLAGAAARRAAFHTSHGPRVYDPQQIRPSAGAWTRDGVPRLAGGAAPQRRAPTPPSSPIQCTPASGIVSDSMKPASWLREALQFSERDLGEFRALQSTRPGTGPGLNNENFESHVTGCTANDITNLANSTSPTSHHNWGHRHHTPAKSPESHESRVYRRKLKLTKLSARKSTRGATQHDR